MKIIELDNPESYDKQRVAGSSFHRLKFDKLFFKYKKNLKVLELGCGTGIYTCFLKERFSDLTVLDTDFLMLKELKNKNLGVNAVEGDCLNLPFKDSVFDLVVGFSVFHHIKKSDWQKFFAEANRVLVKGGKLVLTDPNKFNFFVSIYQLLQGEQAISELDYLQCKPLVFCESGSMLFRSPRISGLFDRIPFYSSFEDWLGYFGQGVTVFLVASQYLNNLKEPEKK